ncbi:MAG: DUF4271 domain-containing protein [Flavobacteriaceae bacterium]|nr:DUF4271 domain-containing protein [Flavobacteriaceae bacterium]
MFEGLEKLTFSSDWITIVLMVVLILIALLKIIHNERFSKLFSLMYSEKYYTEYSKTNPLLLNNFHIVSFFIVIFNISLLIFNSFNEFSLVKMDNKLLFFTQINLLVIGYFSLRYFLGFILAYLFDIDDKQKHVTFLKISNLILISILLYPLLILINYSVGSFHKFIITLGLIGVIILFFLRYFNLLKKDKINFNSLFYLFLYLCALEIAPFIVIYKTFVD